MDANPTLSLRVDVVRSDDRKRLVARATLSTGTGSGDKLIETQDELWRFAADYRFSREDVVFGEGAFAEFTKLPKGN